MPEEIQNAIHNEEVSQEIGVVLARLRRLGNIEKMHEKMLELGKMDKYRRNGRNVDDLKETVENFIEQEKEKEERQADLHRDWIKTGFKRRRNLIDEGEEDGSLSKAKNEIIDTRDEIDEDLPLVEEENEEVKFLEDVQGTIEKLKEEPEIRLQPDHGPRSHSLNSSSLASFANTSFATSSSRCAFIVSKAFFSASERCEGSSILLEDVFRRYLGKHLTGP
ncbi:hypothetical protein C9439_07320 [archaeon SCG-AAA382B04]|nr:hypothetical protein C9439_07320 [archaeon SCG-AAA382B04]